MQYYQCLSLPYSSLEDTELIVVCILLLAPYHVMHVNPATGITMHNLYIYHQYTMCFIRRISYLFAFFYNHHIIHTIMTISLRLFDFLVPFYTSIQTLEQSYLTRFFWVVLKLGFLSGGSTIFLKGGITLSTNFCIANVHGLWWLFSSTNLLARMREDTIKKPNYLMITQ